MGFPFEIYVIQAVHGLVYGMLLFLVASGLTLVFGMMGVLNLAHAGFYMLGAYFAYSVVAWSGQFWLSLIFAPICVGVAGGFVERFLLRKVHISGHVYELLLTFGVFLAIGEVVKWFWGNAPLPVQVPPSLAGSVHIMGATYPYYRLFILCCGVVVLLLMVTLIKKTRIGITMRERDSFKGGYLSGGEQQMLTIGRTLMGDPRLMLLDEPTEGLAPQIVEVVANVIREIHRSGVSVLLVEQSMDIVMDLANGILIMNKGEIVFKGTPEELNARPELREKYLEV